MISKHPLQLPKYCQKIKLHHNHSFPNLISYWMYVIIKLKTNHFTNRMNMATEYVISLNKMRNHKVSMTRKVYIVGSLLVRKDHAEQRSCMAHSSTNGFFFYYLFYFMTTISCFYCLIYFIFILM